MRTLTGRTVLITCLVALVSVLVTGVVAYPLALRTQRQQAKDDLAGTANVVADLLGPRLKSAPKTAEPFTNRLRQKGVEAILVRDGKPDRVGVPARAVTAVANGESISMDGMVNGHAVHIEGRPAGVAGGRDGIILTAPLRTGAFIQVIGRLWLALLAGLAAGLLAGFVLARRLAGPIRRAAQAARAMSAGDRSVRLSVDSPVEVGDLSHAINDLSTALATSEGRQRDFLLSVSHELRTPLTTIRGYGEALADGVIGPDGAPKAGKTVLAEAERLERLVGDLLALARLDAVDFRLEVVDVELAALAESAAHAWAPRCADAGVQLRLENAPAATRTDPGRLRQILDVLVENALRQLPTDAPLVLATRTEGNAAVLEVRDGGPGLTDDDLAVAFERGALHDRYHGVRKVGTGLGLALAARLVTRLGGMIRAGHAAEGGARFTVYLPLAAAGLTAPLPGRHPNAAPAEATRPAAPPG